MKGYKGFEPGLICRGKQYAENTVFEEEEAENGQYIYNYCILCMVYIHVENGILLLL